MNTPRPAINEGAPPVPPKVQISSLAVVTGWRLALLALAAQRFQPLHTSLGVPLRIAAQPAHLAATAQRFGILLLALRPIGTQGERDYCQAIQSMVQDVFTALHAVYPAEDVQALYNWAMRHFVDADQRNCWLVWTQLLRRAANLAGLGYPAVPLPAAVANAVQDFAQEHLTLALQAEDGARLVQASQSQPSALEESLLAQEPDLIELLVGTLEEAQTSQRSHVIWNAIKQRLRVSDNPNEDDSDASIVLLRWGREQAAAMHIPADLVTLPASQ